ncbi:MAG: hypothetical protein HYX75_01390 [Acidobacteria bacterium]|nr:hypothetical protein [Acidobacteriota bacterium]
MSINLERTQGSPAGSRKAFWKFTAVLDPTRHDRRKIAGRDADRGEARNRLLIVGRRRPAWYRFVLAAGPTGHQAPPGAADRLSVARGRRLARDVTTLFVIGLKRESEGVSV